MSAAPASRASERGSARTIAGTMGDIGAFSRVVLRRPLRSYQLAVARAIGEEDGLRADRPHVDAHGDG